MSFLVLQCNKMCVILATVNNERRLLNNDVSANEFNNILQTPWNLVCR